MRVASCGVRVDFASCELKFASCSVRVDFVSWELKFASCEFQFARSKMRVASFSYL